MIDIVLFCAVVIVPLLLALLVMDVVDGTRPRFRTNEHTLASAGVFWDRPARKLPRASVRGSRQDAELGGAPVPAQRPLAQPDDTRSPTLPVAADGATRLPASV